MRAVLGLGGGQGDTLMSLPGIAILPGEASAVVLLLNDRRRWLALIQAGYTELLLNEDERTKEEMGNVNFKRPGFRALALCPSGVEAAKWMQIHLQSWFHTYKNT